MRIIVKLADTNEKIGEASDWAGVRRIARGRVVRVIKVPVDR